MNVTAFVTTTGNEHEISIRKSENSEYPILIQDAQDGITMTVAQLQDILNSKPELDEFMEGIIEEQKRSKTDK